MFIRLRTTDLNNLEDGLRMHVVDPQGMDKDAEVYQQGVPTELKLCIHECHQRKLSRRRREQGDRNRQTRKLQTHSN
jgi:hypothetical protein